MQSRIARSQQERANSLRKVFLLLVLLALTGCAPIYMSIYDEDRLNRSLSIPMTKEQVLDAIGKPDELIVDDGRTIVWQYDLYPSDAPIRGIILCPLSFGVGCLVPLRSSLRPHWVVLIAGQLCRWGNRSVASTRSTCMTTSDSQQAAAVNKSSQSGASKKITSTAPRPNFEQFRHITPVQVLMPQPITSKVRRIAIIHPEVLGNPLTPDSVLSDAHVIAESIIFSLRPKVAGLEIVERSDIEVASRELVLQHNGLVRDDELAGIGKMFGADHLLVYSLTTTSDEQLERIRTTGGQLSALVSWKLIQTETGRIVYHDAVLGTITLDQLPEPYEWIDPRTDRRAAVALAFNGLYASILHAFVPGELGIVVDPNLNESGVKIFLVLLNSPASSLGLKPGDVITKINGSPIRTFDDADRIPFSQMNTITILRGAQESELPVRR